MKPSLTERHTSVPAFWHGPRVLLLCLLAGLVTVGAQTITTVVGRGPIAGKSYSAVKVSIEPNSLAIDAKGDLYIADYYRNRVFKVDPAGNLTAAAGDGQQGYGGDGGPAAAAQLDFSAGGDNEVGGVAADAAGDLYIADTANNVIRKVDAATGIMTTIAGNGTAGYSGDGGAATAAELNWPIFVAVDASGDVFVTDEDACVVREIVAATGEIETIAGQSPCNSGGFTSGTGFPATKAALGRPKAIAVGGGTLYIAADEGIRAVNLSTGVMIGTIPLPGPDGTDALALDGAGDLFATGEASPIGQNPVPGGEAWERSAGSRSWVSIAGGQNATCNTGANSNGDGGPASTACLDSEPNGIAVDGAGDIYISEDSDVRKVTATTGTISTVAGTGQEFSGIGGPAVEAELTGPEFVSTGKDGSLIFTDDNRAVVYQVDRTSGTIQVIAGGGSSQTCATATDAYGDGCGANSVYFGYTGYMQAAQDASGNLYLTNAGVGNPMPVQEVPAPTGVLQALPFGGDGVAVDSVGDLYVSSVASDSISEVMAGTGKVVPIAGSGKAGYSGDGGPATTATLSLFAPSAVFVDSSGNVFIPDSGNNAIREVVAATGIIESVAGGVATVCAAATDAVGDGCPATQAKLNQPRAVYVNAAGDIYIADSADDSVRVVDHATGLISTLAGVPNTTCNENGDGGPAAQATLCYPNGITGDAEGDIVVSDFNFIREIKTEAAATLSAASLDLGSAATGVASAAQTITVTNNGGIPLTVSGVQISGADASDFVETNTCTASGTAPGSSCTVQITFTPSATGSRTATLAITDNAPGGPQTVALSGSGLAAAAVTLSASTLTFDSDAVGAASATQAVKLTNSGGSALAITSVGISGANASDFSETNTCGSSVAAGGTCSITVMFTPSATGSRTATLNVSDNATGSPQTVALSGTGADVTIGAASGSSTSATVSAGKSATYTLSFTPVDGLTGTFNLTCSGAPKGATCTPNPASITLSGSSAVASTITVSTTANSEMPPVPDAPPDGRWPWTAWALLAALLMLGASWFGVRGPARPRRLAAGAAGFALLILLAGCGGGSATTPPPPPANNGTPAGTYTLVVTASNGTVSRKINLTLTVQ